MTIIDMEESTTQPKIQFEKVEFLAPTPLVNWINQQASENGIDAEQFLNTLLYSVWCNYVENLKQNQDAQKELSS
jgi:hypothetical protein